MTQKLLTSKKCSGALIVKKLCRAPAPVPAWSLGVRDYQGVVGLRTTKLVAETANVNSRQNRVKSEFPIRQSDYHRVDGKGERIASEIRNA
jgi:hypothetical protein